MQKKKILLVDDSEIYRDLARYMLESRGYEVVVLSSPFAFGAALTRERPDLALVDAFMPALQGDQLVRLARQNNLWDCPIVLHSDRSTRDLQQMVETSGATGFVAKTGDPDKLALAIEGFLKEGQPSDATKKPTSANPEPISRRMTPAPESRRPPVAPESYRPPLEGYRPSRENYRPPRESYRPALDSYPPPESYRSPPESRRPPMPPESRRTPPPESRRALPLPDSRRAPQVPPESRRALPLPDSTRPSVPPDSTRPPPPPESRRPGKR
jgi:CheY-like chemotaxis protein